MKLIPDMYQLNTFNITKTRASMNEWVVGGGGKVRGDATKKPAENATKLRGT